MAIDTGFPIIPVAMKNTDYAMGKRQNSAYPAICEMVMLAPFETKNLTTERDCNGTRREKRNRMNKNPVR